MLTPDQTTILDTYIKLLNDNIREAYSFAKDQSYYETVGASYTVGKKYIRVVQNTGQRSVHCFIDSDLNVYKAASWATPAKGIRYNLNNDMDKLTAILAQKSAYCGGYLYR
jgi:hypothetical protein